MDTGTVNSTYISHYPGPGDTPAWTIEPVSGHWTRNVPGIAGLAAIETSTEGPILQLTDLQGNIIRGQRNHDQTIWQRTIERVWCTDDRETRKVQLARRR